MRQRTGEEDSSWEEKGAGTADSWLTAEEEGWESTPIQRYQPGGKNC